MIGQTVNIARGEEVSIKELGKRFTKTRQASIKPVFEKERPGM